MATIGSPKPVEEEYPQNEELSKFQHYADNFNRLCRLCLSKDQLVSIYSNVRGREVYYMRNFVKFTLDLLAIKINLHDNLPKFVCENCERNLSNIFNFKKKCDKSLGILQCVRESIIKRNDEQNDACLESSKTVPTTKLKRKRRLVTKQPSYKDILKKLPPGINVGKASVISANKSTLDLDIQLRHPSSTAHCERDVERKKDPIQTEKDHIFNEVLNVDDQDQTEKVHHDDSKRAHSEEPVGPVIHVEDEKEVDLLEITGDFVELPVIAAEESETEKGKPNGRRRVVCPICGAMVNNVKSHLITHSEIRPHQCEQCPKSFASRNKLQSHINSVHLRKRDFKCDICGKAFLEKNNLKGHMRIHSGERKYSCDICPKSFLFAGTLRTHKLTHTQEKKHECHICGKLFLMRSTLNKHLNVHTGDRPHKCDLCDKRFRTSTHKVVHMRTHTGEKPLVCYICEMSFAHHKARSVHMKAKHPEELVRMGLIDNKGHLKL